MQTNANAFLRTGEENEETIPDDEKKDMDTWNTDFIFRRFSGGDRISDESFVHGGKL